MIELRPLTIGWGEWKDRIRETQVIRSGSAKDILIAVSAWNKKTSDWLLSLSDDQRHDLAMLAMAEMDMLWQSVDQDKDDDNRLDFRSRFYEVQALVALYDRLALEGRDRLRLLLSELESYAIDKHNWLP